MSADDDAKRRAIRNAIDTMRAWFEKVGAYPDMEDDIRILEDMLLDVRQLPLPLAAKE